MVPSPRQGSDPGGRPWRAWAWRRALPSTEMGCWAARPPVTPGVQGDLALLSPGVHPAAQDLLPPEFSGDRTVFNGNFLSYQEKKMNEIKKTQKLLFPFYRPGLLQPAWPF